MSKPRWEAPNNTSAGATAIASTTTAQKSGRGEYGEEKVQNEDLPIGEVPAVHGKVRVSLGLTLNLGNYESARIDISCEMPHAPTPEARDAAHEQIRVWVTEKLQEEVAIVRGPQASKF